MVLKVGAAANAETVNRETSIVGITFFNIVIPPECFHLIFSFFPLVFGQNDTGHIELRAGAPYIAISMPNKNLVYFQDINNIHAEQNTETV